MGTNQVITLLSAVTATATGDLVRVGNDLTSYQATVVGTSAVTATVLVEGSNDTLAYLTLGTITLSGVASSSDGFTSKDRFAYKRAKLTAVSGAAAAVTVTMGV